MEEKDKLKIALNIYSDSAPKANKALADIHKISKEVYGIDYSDKDIDAIIDCLEYGDGMTFEEFDRIMRKHAANH